MGSVVNGDAPTSATAAGVVSCAPGAAVGTDGAGAHQTADCDPDGPTAPAASSGFIPAAAPAAIVLACGPDTTTASDDGSCCHAQRVRHLEAHTSASSPAISSVYSPTPGAVIVGFASATS